MNEDEVRMRTRSGRVAALVQDAFPGVGAGGRRVRRAMRIGNS